jgi:hypothetical protein
LTKNLDKLDQKPKHDQKVHGTLSYLSGAKSKEIIEIRMTKKLQKVSRKKQELPKDETKAWLNSSLKHYERIKVKFEFDRLKSQMICSSNETIDDFHVKERFDIIIGRMESEYPHYRLLERGNAHHLSKIYISLWKYVNNLLR